MSYSKNYVGFANLPEVKELKSILIKRGYSVEWCDDMGLRMQKWFTEIHFIPESDRLRLCIHDDGLGEEETDEVLKIAAEIVLKHGYRQGTNIVGKNHGMLERDDEYYKYF